MSKKPEKEHQVYFLNTDAYVIQVNEASQDCESLRNLIHHYSDPSSEVMGSRLSDICEYYILLQGYINLLEEIGTLPVVPGEDPNTHDYVLPPEQMLLMKFYISMCAASEIKLKDHGLSLLIN